MSLNKKISEIFCQLEYPAWPDEFTIWLIGNFGHNYLSTCSVLEKGFNFEFKA